jgi:hypothetical protein
MDKQEFVETAASAHDLRICCRNDNADEDFLQILLETCRSKQIQVKKILEEGLNDPNSEVTTDELVSVNASLLDSIKVAEALLERKKRAAPLPVPPVPQPFKPTGSAVFIETTGSAVLIETNVEIDVLVQTRDIFSLLCMLRAQGDRRLESALALMR